MRNLLWPGMCLLLIAFAVPAMAVCPHVVGTWMTMDGSLLPGRVSEAWCADDGTPGAGEPGNMENAMSWQSPDLGMQWRVWGMYIDAQGGVLINTYVHPNGNITYTYRTNYLGGEYWLSGTHTWADGVDLTGVLTSYFVITDITYSAGGDFLGAVSNVNFTGAFTACPEANGCVIDFAIANAILVWRPGFPTGMPADYPPFLCSADTGELFDACCITIHIDCVIPNELTTWGALKTCYR